MALNYGASNLFANPFSQSRRGLLGRGRGIAGRNIMFPYPNNNQYAGIILFMRNTAGTVKVWPRQDWDILYSAPIAFTGTRNFRLILTAMVC